jgi:hypothetical protein
MDKKLWNKLLNKNSLITENVNYKTLKKNGEVELQYVVRQDGKDWYRVIIPGGVFVFSANEKKKAENKFKEASDFVKGMERFKD